MLRKMLILFLMATASCGAATVSKGNFGLGIIIGEPTGVSFKLWTSSNNAVDGALAWSLDESSSMNIHADYLWHDFSLIKVQKGRMPLYFGIGGRIRTHEHGDSDIGARVPVGLEYLFQDAPIDIFLEVVPILDLAPETDFDLGAGVGARFYF